MSNLEAVDVLKRTGQMVTLIVARVKEREATTSEDGSAKQLEQGLGLVMSSADDLYSMFFLVI